MPSYFAGIGGQKCGTGWLSAYLKAHPQVCPSPLKEMHVFDWLFAPDLGRNTEVWAQKRIEKLQALSNRVAVATPSSDPSGHEPAESATPMFDVFLRAVPRQLEATRELLEIVTAPDRREALRRYAASFEGRTGPNDLIFGEIPPAYCLLPPEGFEAMLALYPAARLVFIMRDPVDRFWSAVRHKARADPTFDPAAGVTQCLQNRRFLTRSDYRRTLTVLDGSVPAQQVLTVFYEDLFAPDDDSTLRRITSFLGIDFVAGERERRVLEGVRHPMPDEARAALLRTLSDQYRYVADRLVAVPERWRARLDLLS